LSSNPSLQLDFVLAHPDLNWDFSSLFGDEEEQDSEEESWSDDEEESDEED
jgi:hypothetical protein